MEKYFSQDISKVESSLASDSKKGLSREEAQSRLDKYGPNILEEKKSFISRVIGQFSDFLVIILIIAALISYFVGEKKDAIVIISIVVVNALLGLFQEGKAEKSLEALKKMSSPFGKVIRSGELLVIETEKIVPGDLVVLEGGDIVPADLRLVETFNLKIQESSLTGESLPVDKDPGPLDPGTGLGDRTNMAYMNTSVAYGRGLGLVVSTGHNTEIGKIATSIQSFDDEETPLQKQLSRLGKTLGLLTIGICIFVFFLGIYQGKDKMDMFMISVSLAVAAIPEGLPAIVTIVLALGMNRMVKRNAIVKRLVAVETLGSTSVICSDKTGTLTENQMTVVKAYTYGNFYEVTGEGYKPQGDFIWNDEKIDPKDHGNLSLLSTIAGLVNDSSLVFQDGVYSIIGDPTEGALVSLSEKAGLPKDRLNEDYKRLREIPFDSDRKMMTSFHDGFLDGKFVAFTKGAPDVVISKASRISTDTKVLDFSPEMKEEVLRVNSQFASSALRVLAFAYKEYQDLPDNPQPDLEDGLTFVGLVGMIDPARKEAKEAILRCKEAGIDTIMITGDYKETAFAIGKNLGMVESEDQAVLGSEIDSLSDDELRDLVKTVKVFSRVSPDHKVMIISALKANGHITAMTGDGVNDALALKKADIGVAMGITGTDVAKNTADLILMDDNFSSIVAAVEEGRRIYSNISKFVFFLLSCNIGEIILILSSILMKLPMPLLPIQLLWLNLVTDSFPALALGVEGPEPNIMKKNPRNPKEGILNKRSLVSIGLQSITIGLSALLVFQLGLEMFPDDINKARTMVFTSLIISELLRAYSSRSQESSLLEIGIFSNKSMVLATGFSFLLLILVLYVESLQGIFNTFPLGLESWKYIIPLAFIPLVVGEIDKKIFRK